MLVHRSPGITQIFNEVRKSRSNRILDLGPMASGTFDVFASMSCKMHFENLDEFVERYGTLSTDNLIYRIERYLLSHRLDEKFDVVLSWDLFNYMELEVVSALTKKINRYCKPNALLHINKYIGANMPCAPRKFNLLDQYCVRMSDTSVAPRRVEQHQTVKMLKALPEYTLVNSLVDMEGMQPDIAEYVFIFTPEQGVDSNVNYRQYSYCRDKQVELENKQKKIARDREASKLKIQFIRESLKNNYAINKCGVNDNKNFVVTYSTCKLKNFKQEIESTKFEKASPDKLSAVPKMNAHSDDVSDVVNDSIMLGAEAVVGTATISVINNLDDSRHFQSTFSQSMSDNEIGIGNSLINMKTSADSGSSEMDNFEKSPLSRLAQMEKSPQNSHLGPSDSGRGEAGDSLSGRVKHYSPSISRLESYLHNNRTAKVLDLGQDAEQNKCYWQKHCDKVYSENVLASIDWRAGEKANSGLRSDALCFDLSTKFDVIVLWDILNYCNKKQIRAIGERLAHFCHEGTQLMLIVYSGSDLPQEPQSFELTDDYGELMLERKKKVKRWVDPLTSSAVMKLMSGFGIKNTYVFQKDMQPGISELVFEYKGEELFHANTRFAKNPAMS